MSANVRSKRSTPDREKDTPAISAVAVLILQPHLVMLPMLLAARCGKPVKWGPLICDAVIGGSPVAVVSRS